ncbi:MAG: hypothetical protein WAM14_01685, partial [Candidatus Nitrosopolaris sp.]
NKTKSVSHVSTPFCQPCLEVQQLLLSYIIQIHYPNYQKLRENMQHLQALLPEYYNLKKVYLGRKYNF